MKKQRISELKNMMDPCVICPRRCRVNRLKGETGFCGIGANPVVSSAAAHFGEESVLVGTGGSGTIFFAGCNLGCIFCQNYDISHQRYGSEVTVETLANFMLELQTVGCMNINLVSPTHLIVPIAQAIIIAKNNGLNLPIVYNTGGYDSAQTLKLLDGLIDIYMPDMKYSDNQKAKLLSNAENYPEVNRNAVKEMYRQVGDLVIENHIAKRGLLIRHLVLPNSMAGGEAIIDFLADEISRNTAINVMAQYRPCYHAFEQPNINRSPTSDEVTYVEKYAAIKGLRLTF
jgi:putative pyruvate formate lyase activating enzyme